MDPRIRIHTKNGMDPEHCNKHSPELIGTTSSGLLMLAELGVQRFTIPHRPLMLSTPGAFYTDRAIQTEQKITHPNRSYLYQPVFFCLLVKMLSLKYRFVIQDSAPRIRPF
jgi:hypothetical protein